jgi:valyl-tRNA synthetase
MSVLQSIVTAARELRADLKIDPKQLIDGILVVREPAREIVDQQISGIERLAGAKLQIETTADSVEGVKRGFPEFDLIIRVSTSQAEAQRQRIQKEIAQLEKLVASSEKQLGDETFISRAPAKVVDSIRDKLAGYQAQLSKVRESL